MKIITIIERDTNGYKEWRFDAENFFPQRVLIEYTRRKEDEIVEKWSMYDPSSNVGSPLIALPDFVGELCLWEDRYPKVLDESLTGPERVRDPQDPCYDYATVTKTMWAGGCQGDGHYLCAGCVYFNRPA